MASSAAPDAPAAMAVDREAESAGALSGPEEDIDDDVLANLLSASFPLSPGARQCLPAFPLFFFDARAYFFMSGRARVSLWGAYLLGI